MIFENKFEVEEAHIFIHIFVVTNSLVTKVYAKKAECVYYPTMFLVDDIWLLFRRLRGKNKHFLGSRKNQTGNFSDQATFQTGN